VEAAQAGGIVIIIIIILIIIISSADAAVCVVLIGDGIRCGSLLVIGDWGGFGCCIVIVFRLQDLVLVVARR
jgi:hypothetical protein